MEREVIITGIGGQGIQLMAKVLAHAANRAGKQVMLFGMYQGMMRGGSSESTIVLSDTEIQAPPIIPLTWSVLAMHPFGLVDVAKKLRPGGVLMINTTLVTRVPRTEGRVAHIPATKMAEEAGNLMGAGMIALGAFCAITGLVSETDLVAAMRDSLPPHRQHLAEVNVRLLARGVQYAAVAGVDNASVSSAPTP